MDQVIAASPLRCILCSSSWADGEELPAEEGWDPCGRHGVFAGCGFEPGKAAAG